jgi:plastocyanin
MQNDDTAIPHSLQFQFPGAPTATLCTGPCRDQQTFQAPPAGAYQFVCSVHPEMTGRFVVS